MTINTYKYSVEVCIYDNHGAFINVHKYEHTCYYNALQDYRYRKAVQSTSFIGITSVVWLTKQGNNRVSGNIFNRKPLYKKKVLGTRKGVSE